MKIMETKQMKVPISFEDYSICPHCGTHSVKAIDKYNREMDLLIYPISKLHCSHCGTDFFPNWINGEGTEPILVAGDNELKKDFSHVICEYSELNRRNLL